jgi:type 1 glutamine amidotransferase
MRRLLGWFVPLVLLLTAVTVADAQGEKKIRVVIIDGQNNHNWKATTPVMKKALEECGRFTVDVATSPQIPALTKPTKPKDETDEKAVAKYKDALSKYEAALPKFNEELKAAQSAFAKWQIDFDKYDVVVSNYNGGSWPKEINDALDARLKAGKIGLVIVHAANNAFGGWKEYNLMIGMGWRGNKGGDRLILDENGKEVRIPSGSGDSSGHRYSGKFSVNVRDAKHPITKDMPLEWLHNNDELYDNMRGPIENVHLLATAYSKGTKAHEPMIWTVSYGKGRVFHTPMGHDVGAMNCVGFQATLQRGTEWAATGGVTLALPKNFPTAEKTSGVGK